MEHCSRMKFNENQLSFAHNVPDTSKFEQKN